jgi:glycosyltransferase involved in cell wall biosynthesis
LRARLTGALNRVSRVLVHAAGDVGLLGDIGVVNAVWLPHGSTLGPAPRAPSVLLAGDAPLIGSTGFVLPHKGLQRLIAAIGLLVKFWPGIRLRLVTSRYPDPVSDVELAECEALVRQLRLDAHVEWHTEFAPNELVLHRLSACDLLVMPYAPTLESSSGAVRQAIASGVPTLVSDLPLFDDLGDAVERLPSSSAEVIAARIDAMLRQPGARAALQERAQDWLADHEWAVVAERLQGMLWGLHRQRLEGLRAGSKPWIHD